MNKLPPILTACLALAACGSEPPELALVGSWGIDPVVAAEELAEAEARGALAKAMAEARAREGLGMRMELTAGGAVVLEGTPNDGRGRYAVADVSGDVVTLSIEGQDGMPGTLVLTVVDRDHMTMRDDLGRWEMKLVRR